MLPEHERKHRVDLSKAKGWQLVKRKSYRIRTKLLDFLESYVSGRYAIGSRYVLFEKEKDILFYKLKYPR